MYDEDTQMQRLNSDSANFRKSNNDCILPWGRFGE